MTETYTGSSKGKRMTKSEWKRLLKQLANSYKNSDVIKKKLSQQKEKEASNAESELENDLNALYS